MRGSLGMGILFLKRLHGGGLEGGAPSLGTLEGMFKQSPDKGISLHRGSYKAEWNLVSAEEARIPGTLRDRGTWVPLLRNPKIY